MNTPFHFELAVEKSFRLAFNIFNVLFLESPTRSSSSAGGWIRFSDTFSSVSVVFWVRASDSATQPSNPKPFHDMFSDLMQSFFLRKYNILSRIYTLLITYLLSRNTIFNITMRNLHLPLND